MSVLGPKAENSIRAYDFCALLLKADPSQTSLKVSKGASGLMRGRIGNSDAAATSLEIECVGQQRPGID